MSLRVASYITLTVHLNSVVDFFFPGPGAFELSIKAISLPERREGGEREERGRREGGERGERGAREGGEREERV